MKKESQNHGYTLIETLMVLVIISILSVVFIADYTSNRQNIFLKQSTGQLAADLRTAQNMSMNTAKFNGQIPGGYGVHFNSPPSSSYIIYADVNGDGVYSGPSENFSVRNLDSKIQISSMAVNGVSLSDVEFIPPDPKICFDGKSPVAASFCPTGISAPGSSAVISLQYASSGLTQTITASGTTGQITLSNVGGAAPTVTPTPGANPPSQVTGFSATAGNAQAVLNWSAPYDGGSAITGYKVYRGTSSGGETLLASGGCSGLGNVLTCTDTGLANGTAYYYKVSAVNIIGEGSQSIEASVTTANIYLVDGYNFNYRRNIALSPATSTANYQVNVALTAANFNYAHLSYPATGQDIRFTGSDGTTVQNYWIESWVNGGTSSVWVNVAASGTSSIYMYYGSAGATVASNGTNTFIYFDDFTTDKGWNLNGGTGTISGGILTKTSSGCVSGNFLGIQSPVIAFPAAGYHIQFDAQRTSNASCTNTLLTGVVTSTNVALWYAGPYNSNMQVFGPGTWSPGNGGVGTANNVYTYKGNFLTSGSSLSVYNSDGSLNISESTAQDVVTGSYKIGFGYMSTATLDNIIVSKYASPAPAATVGAEQPAVPSQVTGLSAAAGNTQVVLNWSAPANNGRAITSYKVYRGATSGGETLLATLGNVLTYTNTSLTNGTAYYYKVSAVNAIGEGSQSAEASAMPNLVDGYTFNYRKNITLSPATSQANYQVKITNPVYDETGLVGSYHFSEGTGTTTADTSGSSNIGTMNGTNYWTSSGKFGNGFSASGDDYVNVPDSASLKPNLVTVAMWVKPNSVTGDQGIIDKSTTLDSYQMIITSGKFRFLVNTGGSTHLSTTSPVAGNWYYLAMTYDGSRMKAYVNGVNEVDVAQTGSINYDTSNIIIGAMAYSPAGYYFNGIIDEVKIYNRALSLSEIQNLYNAKARPDYQDIRFTDSDGVTPLSYWTEKDGTFWAKAPTSGTSSVYMYYGSAGATVASNGTNTFDFFDDFSDGNYTSNPTWTATGSWSAANGYLSGTSAGAYISVPNTAMGIWEAKFRYTNVSMGTPWPRIDFQFMSSTANTTGNRYSVISYLPSEGSEYSLMRSGTNIITSTWTPDTNWHTIKVSRSSSGLFELFMDNVSKGTVTDNTYTASSYMVIYITQTAHERQFDDIRVRKYASPEPVATIGAEQP